jgi:cytochrome c peroxidase
MKNKLLMSLDFLIVLSFFYFSSPPISHAISNDEILGKIISRNYLRPLHTKPFEKSKKYILGQALFFDPILSGNRDISCATCHLLKGGTTDQIALAIGTKGFGLGKNRTLRDRHVVPRNSMDLWNRDNNSAKSLFWDGRVEVLDRKKRIFRSPLGNLLPFGMENILAVQALLPLARADEMLGLVDDRSPSDLPSYHANLENEIAIRSNKLDGPEKIIKVVKLVIDRLIGVESSNLTDWQIKYRSLFKDAYPKKNISDISGAAIGNAISHFEEIAFATRNTPWDDYLVGNKKAISNDAKNGAIIFFGKAKCAVCHNGPLFSDFNFHSLSVKQIGPGVNMSNDDKGRYYVTNNDSDKYKFRTPPLRNVTLTAPYFHDGIAKTLEEAINHHLEPHYLADKYDETGAYELNADQINSLSIVLDSKTTLSTNEFSSLIEFLKTLEDLQPEMRDRIIPSRVPSGLRINRL